MDPINQGTPPSPEQPGNGTPAPEQAPQPGQSPDVTQPSVEALQQQLEQERQQREHWQSQYQQIQPAYTRATQALSALSGQQPAQPPPQDPMETLRQKYKGYRAEDLGVIQDVVSTLVNPLQQQNQMLQQQLAATQQAGQVDYLLSQVANQNPTYFQSPTTAQAVRQEALNFVSQGGQLNDVLLRRMAIIHNAENPAGQSPPQYQPNPQQYAPRPQPWANGMFQPGVSYQPQAPSQPAINPEQQAAEAWIKDFIKPRQ